MGADKVLVKAREREIMTLQFLRKACACFEEIDTKGARTIEEERERERERERTTD